MTLTIWFLHFIKGVLTNLSINDGQGWWWRRFDYSISKALLMLNFTECNNDYDNDETIILASAITLDDELHK